jgi:hypothetical protein
MDFFNHNCNLGVEAVSDEYPGCAGCREKEQKINDLEDKIELLIQQRLDARQEIHIINDQLRDMKAKIFEIERDKDQAFLEVSHLHDLKKENQMLSENILVMGDLYQRTKEKLDSLTCFNVSNGILRQQMNNIGNDNRDCFSTPTSANVSDPSQACLLSNIGMSTFPSLAASKKIERLERELESIRKGNSVLQIERDFFRGRSSELESLVDESDVEWNAKLQQEKERISELEIMNDLYEKQILALNDRLAKVSQSK